jgi:hypothetical protein
MIASTTVSLICVGAYQLRKWLGRAYPYEIVQMPESVQDSHGAQYELIRRKVFWW